MAGGFLLFLCLSTLTSKGCQGFLELTLEASLWILEIAEIGTSDLGRLYELNFCDHRGVDRIDFFHSESL